MPADASTPRARTHPGSRREVRQRSAGGTEAQAKDVCLRLLTDRARSRRELESKLVEKGFDPSVIETVLDRLSAIKLVDDADFAHQWVTSRHRYSGRGKRALSMELRSKGISAEIAAEALATIDADDERERAMELVDRKIRSLARTHDLAAVDRAERDKLVRKLVSMLARRGFAQGMAFALVTEALRSHGTGANLDGFGSPT